MSERLDTASSAPATEVANPAGTDPDAGLGSAAAFASAESQEILNLLNNSDGGACCGGSCCSV